VPTPTIDPTLTPSPTTEPDPTATPPVAETPIPTKAPTPQPTPTAFVPKPLNPTVLSRETEEEIKQSYLADLRVRFQAIMDEEYPNASTEGIIIERYCGTYNNYIVVRLADEFPRPIPAVEEDPISIEGMDFYTGYRRWREPLLVWKDGEFHLLTDAYAENLLTYDDLKNIEHYQLRRYE